MSELSNSINGRAPKADRLAEGNNPSDDPFGFGASIDNKKKRDAALIATSARLNPSEPDVFANDLSVANELRKPVGVVSANPQGFRDILKQKKDTNALIDAGQIRDWISNPENAAIAKDDIESLTAIERWTGPLGRAVGRFTRRLTTVDDNFNLQNSAARAQLSTQNYEDILNDILPAETRNLLNENAGGKHPYVAGAERQALALYNTSRGNTGDFIAEAQDSLNEIQRVSDRIAEIPKSDTASQFETENFGPAIGVGGAIQSFIDNPIGGAAFLAETAAESLPLLAAAGGATFLTRSPAVGAVVAGGGSFAAENTTVALDFFNERGIDISTPEAAAAVLQNKELLQEANQRGIVRGTVIAAFDAVSGGLASRTLINNPLGNELLQGITQAALGSGGEASAQVLSGQELDGKEVLLEGLAEFATAPIEVAAFGGKSVLNGRPIKDFSNKISRAFDAIKSKDALQSLDASVSVSKLKDRAPDKFLEAVEGAGLSDENLYVSADDVKEYFQSKNIGDEEIERWGISPEVFKEKIASGGDVVIPLSEYAAKISGTEDADFITENGVFDPNDFSPAQAERFNEEAAQAYQEAYDESIRQEEVHQEQRESGAKVYDGIYSQLRVAGRSVDVATQEASVFQSFINTIAQRTGQDPLEFAETFGVKIQGPNREVIAGRRRGALDVQLNELRRGGQKANKDSLIPFLKSLGGLIDRDGTVGSFEGPSGLISTTRAQIREREFGSEQGGLSISDADGSLDAPFAGVGVDVAARRAVEEGFLPDLIDVISNPNVEEIDLVNPLFEAIQSEIGGSPVFRQGDQPNSALDELDQILSENAIDLSLSNDEIAKLIKQAEDDYNNQEPLFQTAPATDSDAFKEWFGDSKVVDADGNPLVVYHGTDRKFESFKDGLNGLFFTDNKSIAEGYSNKRSQKSSSNFEEIHATYINIENPLIVDANYSLWDNISVGGIENDQKLEELLTKKGVSNFTTEIVAREAKKRGYDGVIFKNIKDGHGYDEAPASNVYAAFNPTQIKSVNNRGTFDANDPRILYQSAFHGSPHKFNEFSTDAINTGEGAQAFGWGLYFASRKGIAEGYREDLSQRTFVHPDGHAWNADGLEHLNVRAAARRGGVDLKDAIEKAKEIYQSDNPSADLAKRDFDVLTEIEKNGGLKQNDGRLYEVDVPEDNELWVWDDALIDQNDDVINAFEAGGVIIPDEPDPVSIEIEDLEIKTIVNAALSLDSNPRNVGLIVDNEADLYHRVIKHAEDNGGDIEEAQSDAGSYVEELAKDYLNDANRFYDENEERNGFTGEKAYLQLSEALGGDKQASEFLKDKGFSGHKFYDAGSRDSESETFNFVIYDGSSVDVLEYYQSENNNSGIDLSSGAGSKTYSLGSTEINYSVSNDGQTSEITLVKTDKSKRGEGSARKAVESLLSNFDAAGITTFLTAEPLEAGGSKRKLEKFYKSLGFVANKGKNKDFRSQNSFVREPQQSDILRVEAVLHGFAKGEISSSKTRKEIEALGYTLDSTGLRGRSPSIEVFDKDGKPHEVFFQGNQDTKRGSIQFPRGGLAEGQTVINLFESANLSTFLHESGHFFLEAFTEIASHPSATDDLKADLVTINDYLGIKDGETTTRDQHELWARSFEAYALEGKAPSLALADAFARFKSWLTRIYQSIAGLNVNITPEIRDVMDRMLATEQQIAEARQVAELNPLFSSQAPAGMNDNDYKTYQRLARRSVEQAEQRLLNKVMEKVRREKTKWYKSEKDAIRKDVELEINSRPEYRLIEALANEQWIGSDVEVPDLRIDREELESFRGEGIIPELNRSRFGGKRAIYKNDGASLGEVSDYFGFKSPSEMIDQLQNTIKRKDAIEIETDRRLIERYGDPLTDGTIEQEALLEIHSEQQAATVASEARHLNKQANRPTRNTSAKIFKERARQIIDKLPVRDVLRPESYLNAERAAAREAEQAFAQVARGGTKAGDAINRAAIAKEKQLLNHYLYKEAREVSSLIQKGRENSKKYSNKKVRQKIGEQSISQIDQIIERFDFRVRSQKQVARSESLRDFIQRMKDEGRDGELNISDKLLDESFQTHYTRLSVSEIRGIFDTIKNLDYVGKYKNKLIEKKRRRDLNESAGKVAQLVSDRFGTGKTGEQSGQIKNFFNLVFRVDTIASDIDGKELGTFYDEIKRSIDEGSALEQKMNAESAVKIDEIFSVYSQKEKSDFNTARIIEGANGHPWTKQQILGLALNSGTQSNLDRVLDQGVDETVRLNQSQLDALLDTLDKRDWDFVQNYINHINSFWPDLAGVSERMSGVKPKRIEAKPINTKYGAYKGGYYPIGYDPTKSTRAKQDADSALDQFLSGGRGSLAKVADGMTQNRVERPTGRALLYDFMVGLKHARDTTRLIALGEAVQSSQRILNHSEVETAFREGGKSQLHETLNLFLKDIAEGPIYNSDPVNSYARIVKNNFTISKLAGNVKTIALQITGVGQSAAVVGKRNLIKAYSEYLKRPNDISKEVLEKSSFMAERQTTFQKDIFDQSNDIRLSSPISGRARKAKNEIVKYGFEGIVKVQFYGVDVPTWMAAYSAQISKGSTEDAAIHAADRMVARAQGSGLMTDRNALERGTVSQTTRQSDFIKLWTTLGGYMVTKFNRGYLTSRNTVAAIKDADGAGQKTVAAFNGATDLMLLYVTEAVLIGLVNEGLSEDEVEDEEFRNFILKETAIAVVGGVPFLNLAASEFSGYGSGGVLGTSLEVYGKLSTQLLQGELDRPLRRAISEGVGLATGVPTTAIMRFLEEALEGEDFSIAEALLGRNAFDR